MKIIFENEKGTTEGYEIKDASEWFRFYRLVRESVEKIKEADGQ